MAEVTTQDFKNATKGRLLNAEDQLAFAALSKDILWGIVQYNRENGYLGYKPGEDEDLAAVSPLSVLSQHDFWSVNTNRLADKNRPYETITQSYLRDGKIVQRNNRDLVMDISLCPEVGGIHIQCPLMYGFEGEQGFSWNICDGDDVPFHTEEQRNIMVQRVLKEIEAFASFNRQQLLGYNRTTKAVQPALNVK